MRIKVLASQSNHGIHGLGVPYIVILGSGVLKH